MNDINSEKLALWDWFNRTLAFAMQPTTLDLVNDDDDGVPDRMARRMAAILIIDKATRYRRARFPWRWQAQPGFLLPKIGIR